MQVNAVMADRHLACNLLGSPLYPKVEVHIGSDLGIYTEGASLCSLRRLGAGLFGTIATLTTTTNEYAADGAAVSAE
jgi:hypothetical protein